MILEFTYGAIAQLQRFRGGFPVALTWSGPQGASVEVSPARNATLAATDSRRASPALAATDSRNVTALVATAGGEE